MIRNSVIQNLYLESILDIIKNRTAEVECEKEAMALFPTAGPPIPMERAVFARLR